MAANGTAEYSPSRMKRTALLISLALLAAGCIRQKQPPLGEPVNAAVSNSAAMPPAAQGPALSTQAPAAGTLPPPGSPEMVPAGQMPDVAATGPAGEPAPSLWGKLCAFLRKLDEGAHRPPHGYIPSAEVYAD